MTFLQITSQMEPWNLSTQLESVHTIVASRGEHQMAVTDGG